MASRVGEGEVLIVVMAAMSAGGSVFVVLVFSGVASAPPLKCIVEVDDDDFLFPGSSRITKCLIL